uniref:Transmembrane protein n=1 Tax=Chromera velia CCMP2878 TaxID=1169474 RepID=A0A0G4ICZ5_9ALVE|eukprot:Cvel_2286.t1-p1 / transcript=Cvel_2286.t1 / gene=Cvel_2286 / organism=Chromera_velia_CCMP2878 / gene_product=hypothetical protein / transcript_product=hypothetical protein / location=Cvel_scaffold88:107409-108950(-) / protein_length=339 / sequence_SO=supercontig / SO=protein_coding / is_pseudo=false
MQMQLSGSYPGGPCEDKAAHSDHTKLPPGGGFLLPSACPFPPEGNGGRGGQSSGEDTTEGTGEREGGGGGAPAAAPQGSDETDETGETRRVPVGPPDDDPTMHDPESYTGPEADPEERGGRRGQTGGDVTSEDDTGVTGEGATESTGGAGRGGRRKNEEDDTAGDRRNGNKGGWGTVLFWFFMVALLICAAAAGVFFALKFFGGNSSTGDVSDLLSERTAGNAGEEQQPERPATPPARQESGQLQKWQQRLRQSFAGWRGIGPSIPEEREAPQADPYAAVRGRYEDEEVEENIPSHFDSWTRDPKKLRPKPAMSVRSDALSAMAASEASTAYRNAKRGA